jgi:hypothetical protein
MSEHKQPGLAGDVPDYTTMSSSEMITALGDDAMKWSVAFCQMARKLGHHGIDEGWMVGWFANAIEHSSDVRRWQREALARMTPGPAVSSLNQQCEAEATALPGDLK